MTNIDCILAAILKHNFRAISSIQMQHTGKISHAAI